jgi:rhodanese-related sulfurtransferase
MNATTHRKATELHANLGPIEFALERTGVLTDSGDAPNTTDIAVSELATKLADGDDFVLAMAMDSVRFNRAHIPGSIDGDTLFAVADSLPRNREIVVYCTSPSCVASRLGASMLREAGFTNVRRFSGGLAEWVDAGHSIESRDVAAAVA